MKRLAIFIPFGNDLFLIPALAFAFFFYVGVTFAQKPLQIGLRYKIKPRHNLYYSEDGRIQNKSVANKIGWNGFWGNNVKAWVSDDSSGIIKVQFWPIVGNDPYAGDGMYVNSMDSADNFYLIIPPRGLVGDGNIYVSLAYACTEVGGITVPFKYWIGKGNIPNDASADFNAGFYVGRKWGRQRFYLDKERNHQSASFVAAAFTGPTTITIKKETVKEPDLFVGDETNELGWSIGAGGLYSYRDFSIGIFTGFDVPFGAVAQQWRYAGRPWIGFGIGYSLGIFNGGK